MRSIYDGTCEEVCSAKSGYFNASNVRIIIHSMHTPTHPEEEYRDTSSYISRPDICSTDILAV